MLAQIKPFQMVVYMKRPHQIVVQILCMKTFFFTRSLAPTRSYRQSHVIVLFYTDAFPSALSVSEHIHSAVYNSLSLIHYIEA